MSKRRRISDKQASIFEFLGRATVPEKTTTDGAVNISSQLRNSITEAIKQCPLSRWEIAGKMSAFLGQEISKYSIDTWTAESKEKHRAPAEFLPAFCVVTGSREPIRILAEAAGIVAVPGPDALRAEIKRLDEDVKVLRDRKRKRELLLKEIDRRHTTNY